MTKSSNYIERYPIKKFLLEAVGAKFGPVFIKEISKTKQSKLKEAIRDVLKSTQYTVISDIIPEGEYLSKDMKMSTISKMNLLIEILLNEDPVFEIMITNWFNYPQVFLHAIVVRLKEMRGPKLINGINEISEKESTEIYQQKVVDFLSHIPNSILENLCRKSAEMFAEAKKKNPDEILSSKLENFGYYF